MPFEMPNLPSHDEYKNVMHEEAIKFVSLFGGANDEVVKLIELAMIQASAATLALLTSKFAESKRRTT